MEVWPSSAYAIHKEKFLVESEKQMFDRLKNENDEADEQRKILRLEEEAFLNKQKEW